MANIEFLMPRLGADMTEAKLVAWKVKPGESIERGAVIAEVDTAKGVIDVECFLPGNVAELVAQAGVTYPVGAVLARITTSESVETALPVGETPRKLSVESRRESTGQPNDKPAGGRADGDAVESATTRPKITPLARRRAGELGIALDKLAGTGPSGEITVRDIEPAGAGSEPIEDAERSRQRMREAIALAMERSNREIPHYYLATSVEMRRAEDWLREENANRPLTRRLLPVVLTLKAVALSLREVPELNGFWEQGRFRPATGVHVGFAISMRGGGLVTPAIHDVDEKSLDELMASVAELIPRARAGKLRSSELTDAGITLTSLGELGVDAVWGVIYPPQVAIVGAGRSVLRPWVVEGQVIPLPVMELTLAGDHRASDGLTGGRLLNGIRRRLQDPIAL